MSFDAMEKMIEQTDAQHSARRDDVGLMMSLAFALAAEGPRMRAPDLHPRKPKRENRYMLCRCGSRKLQSECCQ